MRHLSIIVSFLLYVVCISCAAEVKLSSNSLLNSVLKDNTVYTITDAIDLNDKTISIPANCTIVFKRKGCINNGVLVGNNTSIEYHCPFIGDNVSLKNCHIVKRRKIKDKDVYLKVVHTQKEIQTLFDISNGIRIELSNGVYNNIEKIEINNNIDVDFNNSTILLRWDESHVAECIYMEPRSKKKIDYCKLRNLRIEGKSVVDRPTVSRRCIQLFYVSDVVLDNITIENYTNGKEEYDKDLNDLFNKTRIGTSVIAVIGYDRCAINNCRTKDVYTEIFWCVPNEVPNNITYFTNNISTNSSGWGSHSFFTILDGRCVIKNNEIHNYNGSAINAFCYDSEISYNKFYDGKQSWAIDLSEGVMYRASNVYIHHNKCFNSRGLVSAFGERIQIENNKWINSLPNKGERYPVLDINMRGERTKTGKYIGCGNNPETRFGTKDILIKGNTFTNNCDKTGTDIISGYFFGDSISYTKNTMKGFSVPVVQLVTGENFMYTNNTIIDSKEGNLAELFIKRGKDVQIENNKFCKNNTFDNLNCTVQFGIAEGIIKYKQNITEDMTMGNKGNIVYTPCLIEDMTKLVSAEIYVKKIPYNIVVETGIDYNRINLKTNINVNK